MNNNIVNKSADNIRVLSAAMVEKAKSGHPGGAMGGADFINILYSEFLNFNPDNPAWDLRDRFFLDPGHMSPMLYAQLTLLGWYKMSEIEQFRQWGSSTTGHPELDINRGVENTSGPLGVGHTLAVGAAIAERFMVSRFGNCVAHKTYAFISDGGIQEEISQGAGRIAGYLGLSNLIMFYDANNIQLSTRVDEVTSEDTALKYKAWGWKVITINGNDADEIRAALKVAVAETEKPVLIIGKTTLGKSLLTSLGDSFENQISTHGQPVSKAGADINKTIENLGGDPQKPFTIFKEVEDYYETVKEKKRQLVKAKNSEREQWKLANPELAKKYKSFLNRELPDIDFSEISQSENAPTRSVSGKVLEFLANKVENMVVASADLSNSDKTENFLHKTKAFEKGDFSGAFLNAGVSELTMAALMNGMALHGGIIPACATFFVFSDYMKPVLRMSALMELPVIYIWTHDSFRVGEDGPTHQPVEHEAQLRLMEQLKNHKGNPSILALRPAGSGETIAAWEMALKNDKTPSCLMLTRQNVAEVELHGEESYYHRAKNLDKGAYIVYETHKGEKPELILLANGSEVSTLYEGAKLFIKENKSLKIRLVSIVSSGLFMQQSQEYREKILPNGVKVLAMTAGLPSNLQPFVGFNGKVLGLDHFGYSAPAQVLDDKFGFTAEKAYNFIKSEVID